MSVVSQGQKAVKMSNAPTQQSGEDDFFSILHTHHTLPVFASGRAFVPSAIENILSNSFFDVFTPLLCERLISGQKHKTMYQIDLPADFAGRRFVDLFRALLSKGIFVLALYRRPDDHDIDTTMLPFVYTSPANNVELRLKDRLFVYCNPSELNYALHGTYGFSLTKDPSSGTMHLSENTTPYIAPTGMYRASDIDKVDYTKMKNNQSMKVGAGGGSERKQSLSVQKPTPAPALGTMSESRSLRIANLNVPFTVVEVRWVGRTIEAGIQVLVYPLF